MKVLTAIACLTRCMFGHNEESAAADNDPAIIAILARAEQVAIPVIVLGEYRYGIAQSRGRATYENWLAGLLNDCFVLDINEPNWITSILHGYA